MKFQKKPMSVLLTGAIVGGVMVWDGKENPHTEPRQYEEPSVLSYEIANSTVSAGKFFTIADWSMLNGGWK